jgi:glycosyltransferase involved in cell wall biosynthesis
VRVLVFHGYLLRGTGSNVYTAELAAALGRLGHEVDLLSQEPDPLPVAGATFHRPDIGSVLPVYVADRYEGFDAKPFPELSDAEIESYLERNVEAVRAVVAESRPDVALANHLVMGPVILARALEGTGIPYAVKIHGSALEYTVKPYPRFMPWAREGLAGASGVLVGSRHTAESLWAALEDPRVESLTRLGPPGVDVEAFAPRDPGEAARGLERLTARLAQDARDDDTGDAGDSAFSRDATAAASAVARLNPSAGPLVTFVGKLIVSKGIDLLLAAWPLVLEQRPDATLAVVGFGGWRDAAAALVAALAGGDLGAARDIALAGREAEGGPRAPLAHLLAFLDALDADASARKRYLSAAAGLGERVVLTGRLEHDELTDLLPACAAMVVPSTFPEAFGMVAAEAAACGALPICAAHSGLAEVTAALAGRMPPETRPFVEFDVGPDAVEAIAARVGAWLDTSPGLRERTREALVEVARERYSWEGVARGVIAAAEGRLDELAEPVAPGDR